MIVTAIEQQKHNKDRFSVFVDGNFVFGLCKADILYFKIKENEPIDKEKFDFIVENLVYIKAQDTAMNFLSFKPRTEREVNIKLKEKEFSDDVINKVITFLKKYNYINDRKYCEMYISDGMRLKKKGKYLLKFELIQRGIDEKIISEVFDEIEVNEVELAKTLIKNKYNLQDEITDKEKQKIYGMLARKGYSYSDIKQALYEVINDE